MVAAALAWPGLAQALTCPSTPLEERIAAADLVFVGRSTGYARVERNGIELRDYRFTVDQEVKGDPGRTVVVRIPARPENGGLAIPEDVAAGVLANRADGTWFTTRCGITDPAAVLASVDEPKGNAVKLLIGVVILLAVVGYAVLRRKRRGPPTEIPRRRA